MTAASAPRGVAHVITAQSSAELAGAGLTIDAFAAKCRVQGERLMIRIVIMLALPVSILLIVLTVTILLSWVSGTGLCGTWIASVLPATYCR